MGGIKIEDKLKAIKNIVSEVFQDDVDFNANLIDQGLDSLKFLLLVTELEDHFDINVLPEDLLIENYRTIQEIHELISKYLFNKV